MAAITPHRRREHITRPVDRQHITRHLEREQGSGTILVIALVLIVLVLTGVVVLLVQATVGSAKAATAADLAALAGADAARDLIVGEPCAVATEVATRNHAVLVNCSVSGAEADIVDVQTRVDLPAPLGPASARARAGPPP